MSPLTEPTRIVLRNGWQPMDPDAAAYITAVETADGQALEEKVKIAIDNFVLGCKADGIWDAIKASCILSGARTLNGALVPLAGTAPTNFNFVSADYNRKTGLVGDGSTKYLNSNRANNADPQNSAHISAYVSTPTTTIWGVYVGGVVSMPNGASSSTTLQRESTTNNLGVSVRSSPPVSFANGNAGGFIGANRSSANEFTARAVTQSNLYPSASKTPLSTTFTLFAHQVGQSYRDWSNARLAFYSIGESLDLALLDARVTDLINKFAEVIP